MFTTSSHHHIWDCLLICHICSKNIVHATQQCSTTTSLWETSTWWDKVVQDSTQTKTEALQNRPNSWRHITSIVHGLVSVLETGKETGESMSQPKCNDKRLHCYQEWEQLMGDWNSLCYIIVFQTNLQIMVNCCLKFERSGFNLVKDSCTSPRGSILTENECTDAQISFFSSNFVLPQNSSCECTAALWKVSLSSKRLWRNIYSQAIFMHLLTSHLIPLVTSDYYDGSEMNDAVKAERRQHLKQGL